MIKSRCSRNFCLPASLSKSIAVVCMTASASFVAFGAYAGTSQDGGLPQTVYIASGQMGSFQNTIASAVAKVLSDALSISVVVRPYSGTTAFFPVVNSGSVAFAIAPAVDFALSYQGPDKLKIGGRNPYPATPNLRLVASGSNLVAGMLVRDSSSIDSVNGLAGLTIAGRYPAHLGAYINTYAHLLNADLSWNDVEVVPVAGLNQGIDALTRGRVDGAVYGVGAPGVQRADVSTGVRFIADDCSKEAKQRVTSAIPGYGFIEIPKGKYTGVASDTCITAYPLYLVTSTSVPDSVIEAITRALYEHANELEKYHPSLKGWTSDVLVNNNMTLPYHEVAIEVYQSKGKWNQKAAAAQERITSN